MAFDSTADLLFRIGADTTDAEANIARFRALLSGGLGALKADFADFAKSTFGDFSTVSAAATSSTALLLTGIVAAGGAALECAHKYSDLVGQIEHGVRVTQIGAEHLSGLYVAAKLTGTNFETLTRGIAFFEAQVSKANSGVADSRKIFDQLGISQAQLAAGEKDAVPLLELVAQRYAALASGAEKVAVARALFSRAGIEDQAVLALLAQGMKTLEERAKEMGVMVGEKDILAFEANRAAVAQLRMELSATANTIGREVLPQITSLMSLAMAIPAGLRKTAEEASTTGSTIKSAVLGALGPLGLLIDGLGHYATYSRVVADASAVIDEQIKKTAALMEASGKDTLNLAVATDKATGEYDALSGVLERVREKLAAFQGDEVKAREEISALAIEIDKARKKLDERQAGGDLKPGEYDRELAAWKELADLIPRLYDQTLATIDEKRRAEIDRQNEDLATKWLKGLVDASKREGEALDALRARLARYHAETLGDRERAADAEIDQLRQKYVLEANTGAAGEALVAAIRRAEHAKIETEAKVAGDVEIARLGEQLERIEHANQTTYERIAAQYQADITKFSAAEEKKVLLAVHSYGQLIALAQQYTAIRAALYAKEQQDLQALANSTGWQGVFGANFASQIRGNDDLWEEWRHSGEQSQMLVRVAMESTKEQGQQMFGQMAEGMGSAIAQALVYSKSIGAAMKQAAASTLESIAAKDLVLAIDALGWGFYDLAMGDYPGAASAFEAAAIFGSVGAAAGVAGRAIAGPQSSAASRAGAGATLPSETAARQANMQTGAVGTPAAGQGGTHVTVNVYGHVYGSGGMAELASAMNDAVLNSDVTLTATNTKTGVQITR